MGFLVVMVLVLVVMYVLMIRPQRQRQREQQGMLEAASTGDDILTSGGIYGTITEVDGDDIVVEIADGLSVHMTRRAIAAVLPPETEVEVEAEEDADATDDTETDPVDEFGDTADGFVGADEPVAEGREPR